METTLKDQLGKNYSSTDHKAEEKELEYILTPQEEETVLRHKLQKEKSHIVWKWWDKGAKEGDIETKLAGTDFNKNFDREVVLQEANKRKHFAIESKQITKRELEKETEKWNELKLQCDANYMFNLMAKTSLHKFRKRLIVNSDTTLLIKVICFFLSSDERFEKELGFSLRKGLWIRGNYGLGKTYLMDCVKDNLLKPINIYSMVEISKVVKKEGDYQIDFSKLIYIDDVGSETDSNVKNFGTNINFFKDFIELYYLNNSKFNQLIISTNNDFDEIEYKYGSRVRSRVKDMFNVIDVTGKDLRG
jgi:hypothetical protein